MPLVGPIAVRVADWSRPQPGWAVMFDEWPLLERLSIARPILPALVYTPLGCYLLWRSAHDGVSSGRALGAYVAGLLIWSLLEYVSHRFSFHHAPETPGEVAYGYVVHGAHHAYPEDSRHWMIPFVVTLPIAAALFLLFAWAGGRIGVAAFGGFIHGYLAYDLLHYFMHRGRLPTALGRYLRQYHMVHHFKMHDRHFGVSSPLWDYVFRTR
jgi:sterol desaturase/sphingolipid hydroxylase (fatty acid hydroxylase superfamily)